MNKTQSNLSKRAWFSIVVLVLLSILSMIDRNSINLMIDPIKQSLKISDLKISLLQGPAFATFFLLGSLFMGWLVDKYSNLWLIFIGVVIWSLATISSGLSSTFAMLVISRCLVGMGESVMQPVSWNIITRLFPKDKLSTAMGMLTAGNLLGIAISFILGGYLISETQNNPITILGKTEPWQVVFILTGLPGLALAFIIFFVPKIKPLIENAAKKETISLKEYFAINKRFLFYHFSGFSVLSIMMNGMAAWGATYLSRIHNIEPNKVGLLLGVVGVPLAVSGAIFAGWLVDRSFKNGNNEAHLKQFAIRAILIALVGGLGFYFDSNIVIPLICFGIIQFLQPFSGVAGASLQISTPEHFRGRISAIFIMFYNAVGLMFGPSLVAFLSSLFPEKNMGIALSINYFILAAIAALLLWRGSKYAAQSIQKANQYKI
jgi:MFS family permease